MPPVLQIGVTDVYAKIKASTADVIINVGGAGSSKSYSSYQWLIEKFNNEKNKNFLVCRKTLPSLKVTAMKEIVDLLKDYQRYSLVDHNKTDRTMYLENNNNWLLFTSIDDPDKMKSTKFNYILIEEGIEFDWNDFMILLTRNRAPSDDDLPNQLIINVNPSDEMHWIHSRLEEDYQDLGIKVEFIYSNYKDNPFLPDQAVKTLESFKTIDEEYYKIYTLGLWATLSNRVFTNFKITDNFPFNIEPIYGLDFGYNNPTALTRVACRGDNKVYIKQCLYDTELDQEELIRRISAHIPNKKCYLYADPEDPRLIDVLYNRGFNIHKADKQVLSGLRYMKQFDIYLDADSVDLIKEFKNYKWKSDRNGKVLDEPIKAWDHLIDAARYPIFTHGQKFWSQAANIIPSVTGSRARNSITKGY